MDQRMFFRVFIFLLTLFCLSSYQVFGNGIPPVRHFTPEDYKGQYQNWMLSSAPDGRLFAANSGGMMYYDGLNWYLHPLPNKQVVRSILYQSPDKVFTGAFAEFGYWAINSAHHWQFNSLSQSIKDSIFQEEEIWHITKQDSLIWFQSFSRIYQYDGKVVKQFLPPGNIMFVEPYQGKLMVPVIGMGLYQLDGKGDFSLFPGGNRFAGDRIVGLNTIQGDLWVATEKRGVFIWDGLEWKSWTTQANEEIKKHTLNKTLYSNAGQLYFGTIDAGVLNTELNGHAIQWLNKQTGLQNNTVLSMCNSKAGHIWLGLDEGIDAILHTPGVHFQVEKDGKIGTSYAFAQHKGKFYVGTNQGLFVADSLDLKAPDKLKFRKISGISGQVWYLSVEKDILIAGHNDGSCMVVGERIIPMSRLSGGWSLLKIPDDGVHLLEGTYSGISAYAFENGRWVWKKQVEGFNQPVKKLLMDRLGNLWALQPNKGLYWIKCAPDWSRAIEVKEMGKINKVPHLFEMDIMIIDGRLIVRSGTLYYEINPENGHFSQLESLRGVSLKVADQKLIGADKRGLWISENGIFRWNTGQFEKAWPVNLIDRYESILATDQYLLAGVHNGFVLLETPINISVNLKENPANSRLLAISAMNLPADPWIISEQMKGFEIPPGVNSVRLWFGRDLLDLGQKLWYRIGNAEWQMLESYVLDLPDQQFGTSDLEWKIGQTGKVSQFEIHFIPRWYKSTAAKALYFLFGIGFLIIFTQFLKRRFQRQQEVLESDNLQRLNQQQVETENALLQADLTLKSRELAFSSQALMHKNAILTEILDEVHEIKAELGSRMPEKHYRRLEGLIRDNIESEYDRNVFEVNFAELNTDWLSRLKEKYPDLTPGDLRLAAYLKMNLSSKEIAPLLGISIRGVENKRYRLRHKMDIPPEENLINYLLAV